MRLSHLVTGIAGAALVAGAASAADMTIVSWGGAYSASQQNAYHDPYMKLHPDIHIINDESSPEAVAKLRAMNEAGNITWDVVDVVASDAIRLCDEGLAMEINPDEQLAPGVITNVSTEKMKEIDVKNDSEADLRTKVGNLLESAHTKEIPASEDFGDMLVSPCFIPQIVYSTTFGYRTDVAEWNGKTPEDVCAVFDLENFPGKRTLEKRPINNMEWALLCDGVPKDEIYDVLETEEGQAKAFAKLDTIKDQTIWWSAAAESIQSLADGEAVIGSSYNGRLFSAIVEQKQPIAMLWDAQVFDLDGWIIPAGLPEERKQRALDYVYWATDTQRLADQAKYISYGPARKSSAPLVGKHATLGIEMGPYMPTAPENAKNTFLYNYEWWADYRDDLDAKFQAWLAK